MLYDCTGMGFDAGEIGCASDRPSTLDWANFIHRVDHLWSVSVPSRVR